MVKYVAHCLYGYSKRYSKTIYYLYIIVLWCYLYKNELRLVEYYVSKQSESNLFFM